MKLFSSRDLTTREFGTNAIVVRVSNGNFPDDLQYHGSGILWIWKESRNGRPSVPNGEYMNQLRKLRFYVKEKAKAL